MADMRFMNSIIYKVILIVGLLFCPANFAIAARALPASDLYFLAQKSFYQLMEAPEKKKFRHNWVKAIKMFSKVVDRYPKSKEAYRAEFTIGKLYEGLNAVSKNSKDLDRAAQHYNNVSKKYLSANLSDDALFRVAEIYLLKRNFASASTIFKEVFEKYPQGDQAKVAQQKYKSIKVASKNKVYAKVATIVKAKHPKPVANANQSSQLKRASSIATAADKKKIFAEFKEKTQNTIVKKTSQPAPTKPSRKTLVKKKVAQPAIKIRTAKKEVNIKDGFGRGYLYNPQIPK
ncbi:MAG: tetratricopeptide (TPR) repeat protein, partial [Nitrospinales bacterium]